jgi:hypothetical protein
MPRCEKNVLPKAGKYCEEFIVIRNSLFSMLDHDVQGNCVGQSAGDRMLAVGIILFCWWL